MKVKISGTVVGLKTEALQNRKTGIIRNVRFLTLLVPSFVFGHDDFELIRVQEYEGLAKDGERVTLSVDVSAWGGKLQCRVCPA